MAGSRLITLVAEPGLKAGGGDGRAEGALAVQELMPGTGCGDDVFFNHNGAHIVSAGVQRTKAGGQTDGEPRGLYVIDIVEHEPGDGHGTQEFLVGAPAAGFTRQRKAGRQATGISETLKLRAGKLHRPADECPKTGHPGRAPVLQRPKAQQMIDALFQRLDVAIDHRGRGAHTERMGLSHYVEPLLRGRFCR